MGRPADANVAEDRERAGERVALRAVMRTRSNALYFHPNLLGITQVAAAGDEDVRVRVGGEPLGSDARPLSLCAMVTLVDVALTAAMRVRISPGALVATASLSLQLASHGVAAPIDAAARAFPVANSEGIATCILERDGRRLGQAMGHFLAQRESLGSANLLLPSDHQADADLDEMIARAELSATERAAVDDVVAATQRALTAGKAHSDELLRLNWRTGETGVARARMEPSAALANRFGNIHGAALYAAGASVAASSLGVPSAFVAGHALFLGPAKGPVDIEASVIRRGRTLASVEARLRSGAEQIMVAHYEFRVMSA